MDADRTVFLGYTLDRVTRQLFAPDGAAVPLTGRAFDVLAHLIAHRDRVVGRDELLDAVWSGRVVEENNLTQAIAALRRAFGTDAGDHRYVLTVPGRGYRFVASLDAPSEARAEEPGQVAALPAPPAGKARSARVRRRPWRAVVAIAALLSTIAVGISALGDRPPMQLPLPEATAARAAPPTLAVLPFRPIGAAPRDELLALGMADTLITRLGRAGNLRVLSLGSAQALSGRHADPLRAGVALGADYVVDGSTQMRGTSIRVNVRLLAVPDGRSVWSGTFDAEAGREFTLQDAMARGLSAAMALRYPSAGRYRSPCDGADAAAYRAYLQGKHLMFRPDRVRLPQAIAAFEQAIARDPGCARAWAGIAFAHRSLAMTADADPRLVFPQARAAVDRALRIDPDSAEAHASKGVIEFWYDWDWKAAEASLRRAIALNDNLSEAHYALAHLLHNIGRNHEGLPHALRAAELDPVSPIINTIVASFLISAGRADEAAVRIDGVLQTDPDFWTALLWRSLLRAGRGDEAGALADMTRAAQACRRCSHGLASLAWLHAQRGDRAAAERLLTEMQRRDAQGYFPATRLALAHEALGRRNEALALLERSHAERDLYLTFLLVDPRLRRMGSEPRYQALQRRMGLVPPGAAGTVAARGAR